MSREFPRPEGVARPQAPYSSVVVDGDLVYTAGQVAFDEEGRLVAGGIEEQAQRALENLAACLDAAGARLEDVLKVNVYLADLADFAGFNAVYARFFPEPYPARTTVGVSLPAGLLVEIEAVARLQA
ncbi:MAG: RidA family protein [Thermoleophilia bacterium]|nr:RidA family protein [Thermoleophilia bacterium]